VRENARSHSGPSAAFCSYHVRLESSCVVAIYLLSMLPVYCQAGLENLDCISVRIHGSDASEHSIGILLHLNTVSYERLAPLLSQAYCIPMASCWGKQLYSWRSEPPNMMTSHVRILPIVSYLSYIISKKIQKNYNSDFWDYLRLKKPSFWIPRYRTQPCFQRAEDSNYWMWITIIYV